MNACARFLGVGLVTIIAAGGVLACSSDSKTSSDNLPNTDQDSGAPTGNGGATGTGGASDGGASSGGATASGGATGAGGAPAAFGDCSKENWSGETDECWSCMCGACKDTLDVCNDDCITALKCAQTQHTLVNVTADIPCEIRATGNLCLQGAKAQAAAQAVLNFDTCLLKSSPDKGTDFRFCDTVCKHQYSGDVCQRFPMGM
jgi:hypothetical protein